ncbi:trypsin-like peptidase domain-containing protein, partial [Streptomyces sp. T-3]|nr:trypsin-like peptidase domain-containing protein [Streptomyces sp. T-3]
MEYAAGLRAEQVAEVLVGPPGVERRGSGYLVAPGRVLTAAHVVAGAERVRVRLDADRPGERIAEATVAWAHPGIDVAVLSVPFAPDRAARFARVGVRDAVLRCSAVGFPYFKLRTEDGGSRFRDSEHVEASCAVLSNRREGTLDLRVAPPAAAPDGVASPWEGMSGAAVFSGGRIVGVVARHHLGDGPGRIAAGRVDRWGERLGADELAELEGLLECPLGADELPDALAPAAAGLARAAYEAQLRDIAPESLVGRERELGELVDFCGGAEPYRWLQAPPWAGKTALMAWFALHPPQGVVPVWFFVTARLAEQADSGAYSDAVTRQLAAIVGREPDGVARDGERRLLLQEAAERVGAEGGTLLLVVDGLDEDQSQVAGARLPSIASLLPERIPANVRVLVASRPHPGVPGDVAGGHPLRSCPVVRLATGEAALHTEYEATHELSVALAGDELGVDLVGFLAAARGSLTLGDLQELTGRRRFEVRQRLESPFGRILRMRGSYTSTASSAVGEGYDAGDRGYVFAHETLLRTAQDELGPDVGPYRDRVHAWAARYAEAGWPEGTPGYLLHAYARTVAGERDVQRAVELAADAARHNWMRDATGSDADARREIDTMRELVRRAAPDDLGSLAALAAARHMLAGRNHALSPETVVAVARVGRMRHAVGLARCVPEPTRRAWALVQLASTAPPDDGQPSRVRSLVNEAVGLLKAGGLKGPAASYLYADDALRVAAVTLMACGLEADALALLGTLDPDVVQETYPDGGDLGRILSRQHELNWVTALAQVAAAAHTRGADCAGRLLRRAADAASAAPDGEPVGHTIRAMAAVADACTGQDPELAGQLRAEIQRSADQWEAEDATL